MLRQRSERYTFASRARGRLDFRITGGHLDLLRITESRSQIGKRSRGQRSLGQRGASKQLSRMHA